MKYSARDTIARLSIEGEHAIKYLIYDRHSLSNKRQVLCFDEKILLTSPKLS